MQLALRGEQLSLNHSVSARQHAHRDLEAELLGRFEIDSQIELEGLFHRQLGRLGALEDLVHVRRSSPVQVVDLYAVGHQSASVYMLWIWVHRWQPVLYCENRKLLPADVGHRAGQD